jgi:hypothetical protein
MTEVATRPRLTDLTYDQLVLTRNKLGEKAKEAEQLASDYKAKVEKIDAVLLSRFSRDGVSNVKTNHGTPYIIERTSCSAADGEAFLSWVKQTNGWDFLEVRPKKTLVAEHIREHGTLPPGLNWSARLTIGVTGKKT